MKVDDQGLSYTNCCCNTSYNTKSILYDQHAHVLIRRLPLKKILQICNLVFVLAFSLEK